MAPDVGLVLAPAYVEAAFVVLIDKLFYATLPSGVDPKDKDFKYLVNQAPRIEALKEVRTNPSLHANILLRQLCRYPERRRLYLLFCCNADHGEQMCLDPGGLIQAFWEQRDEYAKSVHGCKSIKLHVRIKRLPVY